MSILPYMAEPFDASEGGFPEVPRPSPKTDGMLYHTRSWIKCHDVAPCADAVEDGGFRGSLQRIEESLQLLSSGQIAMMALLRETRFSDRKNTGIQSNSICAFNGCGRSSSGSVVSSTVRSTARSTCRSRGQASSIQSWAKGDRVPSAQEEGLLSKSIDVQLGRNFQSGTRSRSAGHSKLKLQRQLSECDTQDSPTSAIRFKTTGFPSVCQTLGNSSEDESTVATNTAYVSASADLHFSAELVHCGLPHSWPMEVSLRSGYANFKVEEDVVSATRERSVSNMLDQLAYTAGKASNTTVNASSKVSRYVLNPDSLFSLIFQTIGVIVLLIDLSVTPYLLAWDLAPFSEPMLGLFAWFTSAFFTLDFAVSFFTGFYHEGELHMKQPDTAIHYFRHWFRIDFPVAVVDWANLILELFVSSGFALDGFSLLRVIRLTRILRVCRMSRMVRLYRYFDGMHCRVVMASGSWIFNSTLVLLTMAWSCHVLACIWYGIASSRGHDTGTSWLGEIGAPAPSFYLYVTSFHWAMVQITLGGIDVSASNSGERLFSIFAVLLGVIFSSSFVSYLSALLIGKQVEYSNRNNQLRALRRYLAQHRVEGSLAARVQRQVSARVNRTSELKYGDVEALRYISTDMNEELRHQFFNRYITSNVGFRIWARMSHAFLRDLCVHSVSFMYPFQDDEVFKVGNNGDTAYCVVKGDLHYRPVDILSDGHVDAKVGVGDRVAEGTWLAEVALWVHWIHVGTASAVSECVLVVIDSDSFCRTAMSHLLIHDVACQHASIVHRCVLGARPPNSAWASDLEVPGTSADEILCSLQTRTQQVISLHSLLMAMQSFVWPRTPPFNATQLQMDILEGALLMCEGKGELTWVDNIVAFHVLDETGNVLLELGELDATSGCVTACCRLPMQKWQHGETPNEAWQRHCDTRLKPLGMNVELLKHTSDLRYADSRKHHGVRAKFMRTVVYGRLVGPAPPGDSMLKQFKILHDTSSSGISVSPKRAWRQSVWNASSLCTFSIKHGQSSSSFGRNCRTYRSRGEDGRILLYGWVSLTEVEAVDLLQKVELSQAVDHWISGMLFVSPDCTGEQSSSEVCSTQSSVSSASGFVARDNTPHLHDMDIEQICESPDQAMFSRNVTEESPPLSEKRCSIAL